MLFPGKYAITVTEKRTVIDNAAAATVVVEKNPLIIPAFITAPGSPPMNKPVINSFSSEVVLVNQFQAFNRRSITHIAAGDALSSSVTVFPWRKVSRNF